MIPVKDPGPLSLMRGVPHTTKGSMMQHTRPVWKSRRIVSKHEDKGSDSRPLWSFRTWGRLSQFHGMGLSRDIHQRRKNVGKPLLLEARILNRIRLRRANGKKSSSQPMESRTGDTHKGSFAFALVEKMFTRGWLNTQERKDHSVEITWPGRQGWPARTINFIGKWILPKDELRTVLPRWESPMRDRILRGTHCPPFSWCMPCGAIACQESQALLQSDYYYYYIPDCKPKLGEPDDKNKKAPARKTAQ